MSGINNQYGLKAENYFLSLMNNLGLKTTFKDDWYDFEVNNLKVEVKSCSLFIKQKKYKQKKKFIFASGKFHFTKKENRKNQFNENIWCCFIVRHKENFLLIGFVKARELNLKESITLSQLGNYNLLSLNDWIKKVN